MCVLSTPFGTIFELIYPPKLIQKRRMHWLSPFPVFKRKRSLVLIQNSQGIENLKMLYDEIEAYFNGSEKQSIVPADTLKQESLYADDIPF